MAEYFELPRFTVDKRRDLTMTEVYQEIGNVSVLGAALGTYEYGFSMTHQYDQANLSEYVRFSIDDGVTWTEFITEPSDTTNDTPMTYNFFKEGVSGDLNIQVQARKVNATGVMTVKFIDTYMRRVK